MYTALKSTFIVPINSVSVFEAKLVCSSCIFVFSLRDILIKFGATVYSGPRIKAIEDSRDRTTLSSMSHITCYFDKWLYMSNRLSGIGGIGWGGFWPTIVFVFFLLLHSLEMWY